MFKPQAHEEVPVAMHGLLSLHLAEPHALPVLGRVEHGLNGAATCHGVIRGPQRVG